MTHVRAELNRLGMAPRKVRLVADAIRGKRVSDAERVLHALPRRASGPIAKLLRSAVANARQNHQVSAPENLTVTAITVDGGQTLKRITPRAMGRAFPIRKRTSHVCIVLSGDGTEISARPKTAPEVVTGEVEPGRPAPAAETRRRTPIEHTRPALYTADFVRRMFRRKAI